MQKILYRQVLKRNIKKGTLMKKFILTALCMPILSLTAQGAYLHVETVTPFSTPMPPQTVKLKSLGEMRLTQEVFIDYGDILVGEITDIKSPKRLKRNATFKFRIYYVEAFNGKTMSLSEHNIGKYTNEFKVNKRKLATSAALKVGEMFASGISIGYRAVEGAVENHEDGVVKGAVENVYDNSLFSYIKKGVEVEKKTGDKFYLSLKPEKMPKQRTKIEHHNDAFIDAAQSVLDR